MNSPLALCTRPESEAEVRAIAEKLLRKAGVAGILPTPLDVLFQEEHIQCSDAADTVKDSFLAKLDRVAQARFHAIWQKIRGIADLRERVVYVPGDQTDPRTRFANGHELAHQVLRWHRINRSYLDDNKTLSPEVRQLFEQEANFFSAEVLFQGAGFTTRSRDFAPTFDAVFSLADDHGTSRHSTASKFVEVSDEALALIPYWPSLYAIEDSGQPVLRKGRAIASPAFAKRFSALQLPEDIRSGHEWAHARDAAEVACGSIKLPTPFGFEEFSWQSWWNNYCLLVLLRRKPRFHLVGRLVHL